MIKENSTIDRTTRLIVTITVFGALFLVFKTAIHIWFKTFTTMLYTRDFFNIDYVIATVFLSISIIISISFIKYIFYELKTYINYEKDNDKQSAVKKADQCFAKIFISIKNTAVFLIIIFISLVIRDSFDRDDLFVIILGGCTGIIVVLGLSFLFYKSIKAKKAFTYFNDKVASNSFISTIIFFIYIVLISSLLGLTLTLYSFNSTNQNAKVTLKEDRTIPLVVELQNYSDPIVTATITNYDSNNEIKLETLILERKEFIETYSGQIKNHELTTEDDLMYLVNNLSTEIDKMDISTRKALSKFELTLENHIEIGENLIEVVMISRENSDLVVTKFMTLVTKENNKIQITEKEFNTSN
ncbi:hypothetical protein [Halalkalibacter urbisdiaboli]|uniref:hypothetical protein n=1 Tax=Halalkalibacter urbisdiaboli TaxID=1960589 RepID=UPI000B43E60B|nr:hypothetical protein [Halalkalibacter urbisdiaboli]